jgi:hypothetical protein
VDRYDVYFSVEETLTEARKKDEKISIKKSDVGKVKSKLEKTAKEKKIKSTKKVKDELEELVDFDGTMNNSKVPILNPATTGSKENPTTMDQTVVTGRITNNPITRGFRVYYGESKKDEPIVEINMEDAFGYEETKDLNGPETKKVYMKMGLPEKDAEERTEKQGKTHDEKEHKKRLSKVPKDIKNQKGFIDRLTLSEDERVKMIKMVEDLLLKNKQEKELREKEKNVSKFLLRNLEVLKSQAEKEGVSVDELIQHLKK